MHISPLSIPIYPAAIVIGAVVALVIAWRQILGGSLSLVIMVVRGAAMLAMLGVSCAVRGARSMIRSRRAARAASPATTPIRAGDTAALLQAFEEPNWWDRAKSGPAAQEVK